MIYITGDCHGTYDRLSEQAFPIQKEMDRNDIVIVAGDFGYWDDSPEQEYWLNWLAARNFTIAFVDGNHENYDMLKKLPVDTWCGGNVQFIRDNIIHLMRGQMFQIQGKRIFTFGGARSHDIQDGVLEADDPKLLEKVKKLERSGAMYRINHLSWWQEELPSGQEMKEGLDCLKRHGWECDFIISHCAPTSVQDVFSLGLFAPDRLTDYLDLIDQKTKYRHWYLGHYHIEHQVDAFHTILYHKIKRII